ncbi:MAG: type I methionyl aminopeptidase [Dehalococcoidia bacterium]
MQSGKSAARSLASQQQGNGVTVKNREELALMYEAGQIVGRTHKVLQASLEAGMTTRDLDRIAEREIIALGGKPAFKGYRGFPGTLCVSINEEIVHGIPGNKVIKEGDLVSMDLGAIVGGLYGDAAVTVPVGEVSPELKALLETGEASLHAGIAQVRAGNRIGDVSAAVQREIERRGNYGIVREYVGHGIGRRMHEEPNVPNYGMPGRGLLLRTGMAIAIEPMVNLGTQATRVLRDDWTVVTADGSVSVHFEHTVIVTDGEPVITTLVED